MGIEVAVISVIGSAIMGAWGEAQRQRNARIELAHEAEQTQLKQDLTTGLAELTGDQALDLYNQNIGNIEKSYTLATDQLQDSLEFITGQAGLSRDFSLEEAQKKYDFAIGEAESALGLSEELSEGRYAFTTAEAATDRGLSLSQSQERFGLRTSGLNLAQGEARRGLNQTYGDTQAQGAAVAGAQRAGLGASGVRSSGTASGLQSETNRLFNIDLGRIDEMLSAQERSYGIERAGSRTTLSQEGEAAERTYGKTLSAADLALEQELAIAAGRYDTATGTADINLDLAGDAAAEAFRRTTETAEFEAGQAEEKILGAYETALGTTDLSYEHAMEGILGTNLTQDELFAGDFDYSQIPDAQLLQGEIDWLDSLKMSRGEEAFNIFLGGAEAGINMGVNFTGLGIMSYNPNLPNRLLGVLNAGAKLASVYQQKMESRRAATEFNTAQADALVKFGNFMRYIENDAPDPMSYEDDYNNFTAAAYRDLTENMKTDAARQQFDLSWTNQVARGLDKVRGLAERNSIVISDVMTEASIQKILAAPPSPGTDTMTYYNNRLGAIESTITNALAGGAITPQKADTLLTKYSNQFKYGVARDLALTAQKRLIDAGLSPAEVEDFLSNAIRLEGDEYEAWVQKASDNLADMGIGDAVLAEAAQVYGQIDLLPDQEEALVTDLQKSDAAYRENQTQRKAEASAAFNDKINETFRSENWMSLMENDFAAIRQHPGGAPEADKWESRLNTRFKNAQTLPEASEKVDYALQEARGKVEDIRRNPTPEGIREQIDELLTDPVLRGEDAKRQNIINDLIAIESDLERQTIDEREAAASGAQADRDAALTAQHDALLRKYKLDIRSLRMSGGARKRLEKLEGQILSDKELSPEEAQRESNEIQSLIDGLEKLEALAAEETDRITQERLEHEEKVRDQEHLATFDDQITYVEENKDATPQEIIALSARVRKDPYMRQHEQDRQERVLRLQRILDDRVESFKNNKTITDPSVYAEAMAMFVGTGDDDGLKTYLLDHNGNGLSPQDFRSLWKDIDNRPEIRGNTTYIGVFEATTSMFEAALRNPEQYSTEQLVRISTAYGMAERQLRELLNSTVDEKPFRGLSDARQAELLGDKQAEILAPLIKDRFTSALAVPEVVPHSAIKQMLKDGVTIDATTINQAQSAWRTSFREKVGAPLTGGRFKQGVTTDGDLGMVIEFPSELQFTRSARPRPFGGEAALVEEVWFYKEVGGEWKLYDKSDLDGLRFD